MFTINIKTVRAIVSLIVVTLAIGAGLYTGCNGRNGSQPKSITMGTFSKAMGNSPYHIAKHFKWFEEDPNLKGVTITYKEFNDRPSISDAFSNGSLQILFSGDAPAILCKAQGNDIKLVALSGNAAQEILVRSELPINSVPELRGKKLAVQQATSSHYALLKILKANNLNESDVDLRYVLPAEARTAFEQGDLDAWAVWAPWVEQQQVSGKGRVVPGGNVLINSVMSVPTKFTTDDEQMLRGIIAAINRAKQWMIANPDEAQKIIAQELGLDAQVVKIAWPKFNWTPNLNDEIITDLQAKADFLAASDKTRSGSTLDVRKDYVDLRFSPNQGK